MWISFASAPPARRTLYVNSFSAWAMGVHPDAASTASMTRIAFFIESEARRGCNRALWRKQRNPSDVAASASFAFALEVHGAADGEPVELQDPGDRPLSHRGIGRQRH